MSAPVTQPAMPSTLGSNKSAAVHVDLLANLLAEQREMTAVEQFSRWHETHASPHSAYQALWPAMAPQAGQQYAFQVDLDACSGCKACVVACHTLNGLDDNESWRKVGLLNSTSTTLPIVQHVTTACHHCVDPGCLHGCPVLAYEKDPLTGIVRHLDDQCFGCKYCLMMCPYEVPQYNANLGIVRKCDMCAGRLKEGEAPACVQACPNQAIRIALVEVSSIVAANDRGLGGSRLLCTAPPNRITQPTTQFISQRTELAGNALGSMVSRESAASRSQPGHEPLVVMLVLTQASVGMWCILAALIGLDMWPAESALAAGCLATLIGIAGVHAALLHLGRPWLAFRSVLGWRTSWLSREAIAFGIYLAVAVAATTVCAWSQSPLFAAAACTTAAILGLAAVGCSAMIYVATRRELWNASRTFFEFGATSAGLGMAMTSTVAPADISTELLSAGLLACILAAFPKLLDWLRATRREWQWSDFSARSGQMLRGELAPVLFQGIGCWTLASCLMIAAYLNHSVDFQWLLHIGAAAALAFSQLILRWLYFASVVFARMPGAGS